MSAELTNFRIIKRFYLETWRKAWGYDSLSDISFQYRLRLETTKKSIEPSRLRCGDFYRINVKPAFFLAFDDDTTLIYGCDGNYYSFIEGIFIVHNHIGYIENFTATEFTYLKLQHADKTEILDFLDELKKHQVQDASNQLLETNSSNDFEYFSTGDITNNYLSLSVGSNYYLRWQMESEEPQWLRLVELDRQLERVF